MKIAPSLTYQDYLQHLAKHKQTNSWDYGMYLRETDALKTFARQSAALVFVLDYTTKHYPFIDQNAHQIMGHPNEAFYEGGVEFMVHHNTDFKFFNEDIFRDRAAFLDKHKATDLTRFRFTMSYRYRGDTGQLHTILQRNTIIHTTPDNQPSGIIGFAWDVSNLMNGKKLIHQIEQLNPATNDWESMLSKEYYPDSDQDKLLSKREIEILKWAIEGYSSKQIADRLHLSVHTVNTHRQHMLRKTNCQNSMDLLRYAVTYGFL